MKPFQLAGNLYFVGTYEASSHLLYTEDGLILLDTGYERTADVIVSSIATLGFDIRDVKYILHSHGHLDHTGGTKKLVALSGAKTCLAQADRKYVHDFEPDVWIQDQDIIQLGDTKITCLSTPGHTEGTVSFFFPVKEKGNVYRAGMFGGAGLNQLKKNYLKEHHLSYLLRGDFFRSIQRLKQEQVDIFIGNHAWQNDTKGCYEKNLSSNENAFIDPTRWMEFLNQCETGLTKIMEQESRELFVNYAHRGASEYCPENTMLSFYTGIFMNANGIETDVQKTKDGHLVLFHDPTLLRVTDQEGKISDYTLEELNQMMVRNQELTDKIVTFEDFLAHFAFRPISFAIELKQKELEQEVADLVKKYQLQDRAVITSFDFEFLCRMKQVAPELRLGYLTSNVTDDTLTNMKQAGIDELCPRGREITQQLVRHWHREGFNVRAWGIGDEAMMEQVYHCGVDGMTVNFPDKLEACRNNRGTG